MLFYVALTINSFPYSLLSLTHVSLFFPQFPPSLTSVPAYFPSSLRPLLPSLPPPIPSIHSPIHHPPSTSSTLNVDLFISFYSFSERRVFIWLTYFYRYCYTAFDIQAIYCIYIYMPHTTNIVLNGNLTLATTPS